MLAGLSLGDADLDRKFLVAAAQSLAGDRRRVAIIEAAGEPDIGVVGADAVRRIETDPADIGQEGLGPGVASLLPFGAVAAIEMAGCCFIPAKRILSNFWRGQRTAANAGSNRT